MGRPSDAVYVHMLATCALQCLVFFSSTNYQSGKSVCLFMLYFYTPRTLRLIRESVWTYDSTKATTIHSTKRLLRLSVHNHSLLVYQSVNHSLYQTHSSVLPPRKGTPRVIRSASALHRRGKHFLNKPRRVRNQFRSLSLLVPVCGEGLCGHAECIGLGQKRGLISERPLSFDHQCKIIRTRTQKSEGAEKD